MGYYDQHVGPDAHSLALRRHPRRWKPATVTHACAWGSARSILNSEAAPVWNWAGAPHPDPLDPRRRRLSLSGASARSKLVEEAALASAPHKRREGSRPGAHDDTRASSPMAHRVTIVDQLSNSATSAGSAVTRSLNGLGGGQSQRPLETPLS